MLNDSSKKLARDLELFLRKLRKELVLFKHVPQHTHKEILKITQRSISTLHVHVHVYECERKREKERKSTHSLLLVDGVLKLLE